MREAREEMLQSLNESNLEKMRKASKGAKQTLKMKDGSIGMDSFTASAIMQIYDKVNDKNKKTMENLLKDGKKADIVKLMKFAMSKVNAEYVPEEFEEEVELDEATNYEIKNGKIYISKANFRKVHKDYKNSTKGKERMMALDPKSGATTSFEVVFEEIELDEKKTITLFKNKQPTAYDRMRRRMNPKDRKTVDASDKKQIKDLESRGWYRSPYGEEVELGELNEWGEITEKAEYNGRPVELNNPTRGDVKKYKVYVKNEKGNVVKVEFGQKGMEIKRDDPGRRANFRARHNCDNPGPKYKARYWSCKFWEKGKSVTDLMKG